MEYYYGMKTKPLTFLLALTFLFFSSFVFGQEKEDQKEFWENGSVKSEKLYSNGNLVVEKYYGEHFTMHWLSPIHVIEYYGNGRRKLVIKLLNYEELLETDDLKPSPPIKLHSIEWYKNGFKQRDKTLTDVDIAGNKAEPFDRWMEWYKNGNKKWVRLYKNKKPDGHWTEWYED